MQTGSFKQKAHPILSWFVIASCVVTVGLLYVMQKAEETAQSLDTRATYQQYL